MHYYPNWERFIFDSAPETSGMLVEKDIPIPNGFKIVLDATGHYILDQAPQSDTEMVFGELLKT